MKVKKLSAGRHANYFEFDINKKSLKFRHSIPIKYEGEIDFVKEMYNTNNLSTILDIDSVTYELYGLYKDKIEYQNYFNYRSLLIRNEKELINNVYFDELSSYDYVRLGDCKKDEINAIANNLGIYVLEDSVKSMREPGDYIDSWIYYMEDNKLKRVRVYIHDILPEKIQEAYEKGFGIIKFYGASSTRVIPSMKTASLLFNDRSAYDRMYNYRYTNISWERFLRLQALYLKSINY